MIWTDEHIIYANTKRTEDRILLNARIYFTCNFGAFICCGFANLLLLMMLMFMMMTNDDDDGGNGGYCLCVIISIHFIRVIQTTKN